MQQGGGTTVAPIRNRKPGPVAKLLLALILIASIVMIWAAVRSFQSAPVADTKQLLPASTADKTQ